MRTRRSSCFGLVVWLVAAGSGAAVLSSPALAAGDVDVGLDETGGKHEVCYRSGAVTYVEDLQEGRWAGRHWSAGPGKAGADAFWSSEAFAISLKDQPTPQATPGTRLAGDWHWVGLTRIPAAKAGSLHVAVGLTHGSYPVTLHVHTRLDGTPVLVRWLEITNTATKPLALVGCTPWCGRLWSAGERMVLGHSLRWDCPWEGWFGWTELSEGRIVLRQDRGLAWDDPYFLVRNESAGEYFFGQLAWPANYTMEFDKHHGLTFGIGPTATAALRVIASGETLTTPAVHLGHVAGDFDAVVQAMHNHVRRSVVPSGNPESLYRIQYSMPEDWAMTVYRGDDFNEANLKKCVDVAAAVGIEVLLVEGPMWCSGYGNWLVPDRKRFPRGLGLLVDFTHEKGMLFGLYVEPEGGRDGFTSGEHGATTLKWSQSRVFQEHPDWFIDRGNIVNLSKPEAADYMESELERIVTHYRLDLYMHDFNAPQRGQASQPLYDGFAECEYWRHHEALYRAFGRLHAKFPNLALMQAAAGGCRSDLATAGAFHEHFASDRASFPYLYRMLSGLSVFLPPETLVAANGMAWPQDLPDLDTTLRGAYALGNTPRIFNSLLPRSVAELKPATREKFLHYGRIYKSFIRPMLPTCKVYHHAPVNATGGVESGAWLAMEFASPDRTKGWATVIRLAGGPTDAYLLRLKGLDAQAAYHVTFDNTGKTEAVAGVKLMCEGLRLQSLASPRSELILLEQIGFSESSEKNR